MNKIWGWEDIGEYIILKNWPWHRISVCQKILKTLSCSIDSFSFIFIKLKHYISKVKYLKFQINYFYSLHLLWNITPRSAWETLILPFVLVILIIKNDGYFTICFQIDNGEIYVFNSLGCLFLSFIFFH